MGTNLNEINNISNLVYKKIYSNKQNKLIIFKPVPSPIDRINNKYRWRIIIKCKLSSKILDIINNGITDDIIYKNNNTRITVDINPNSMS